MGFIREDNKTNGNGNNNNNNEIKTISSKVLTTISASNIKVDEPITVNNVSINKDRRYYIEFLGSKKLCSLLVGKDKGNCIICNIGNYAMQVVNASTNMLFINKINEDDTTTTTFTDLIIYEEEVKYLDNKYLETDLTLQNSISLGRVGDIGMGSSATGNKTTASGDFSHAEGTMTEALGNCSHTEGDGTIALGRNSHAEGTMTKASGNGSHTEGGGTIASGMSSHSEGGSTEASGDCSHAEGSFTTASGMNSHAEGESTKALGENSHAEGNSTTASGDYGSHAEGNGTKASGNFSHSEGSGTTASGLSSHAEGWNSIASSQYQHVQGKFNIEDTEGKYAHIVGNGKNNNTRTNAHTLDWEGNAWYGGEVYVGGKSQDDGKKLLSTADIYFDENGKLCITINGVTKKFTPDSE